MRSLNPLEWFRREKRGLAPTQIRNPLELYTVRGAVPVFQQIVSVTVLSAEFESAGMVSSGSLHSITVKNGDWLRPKSVTHLNDTQWEVLVPIFQPGALFLQVPQSGPTDESKIP